MLACKGIFAKLTMAQVRKGAQRENRKTAVARLPAHYTMKQKCLLAKAFLRSRQWRRCAKAHSARTARLR